MDNLNDLYCDDTVCGNSQPCVNIDDTRPDTNAQFRGSRASALPFVHLYTCLYLRCSFVLCVTFALLIHDADEKFLKYVGIGIHIQLVRFAACPRERVAL